METYVMLIQLTEKGIGDVNDAPNRVDQAKRVGKELGVHVKAFYGLMGHAYDGLLIAEAADGGTMAKFALLIGSKGFVRTETLRAFPEEEYQGIIQALP